MSSLPQRWLSISGLSTVLNLTSTQIKTLYKQKLLVRIGKNASEYRYLDPTPEYAERLRLAAVMLSKNPAVPTDLPLTFLLTIREVAEILQWNLTYAEQYLREKKVPCFKAASRTRFYSVTAVRDMLFQRSDRKLSKQQGPFLLSDILMYFRRFQAAEESIVPTDSQFLEDAALQKKITWLMRQPNRDVLLADFVSKMELAKRVLETVGPDESGTRR
jgi:hypothetical protein